MLHSVAGPPAGVLQIPHDSEFVGQGKDLPLLRMSKRLPSRHRTNGAGRGWGERELYKGKNRGHWNTMSSSAIFFRRKVVEMQCIPISWSYGCRIPVSLRSSLLMLSSDCAL